jgi:hypothetical protein
MYVCTRCILEAGFILIMKSSDAGIEFLDSLRCLEFGKLDDGRSPEIRHSQVPFYSIYLWKWKTTDLFKFATWYPSRIHICHLCIWNGNILGIFLSGMFSTLVSCCPQCTSFFKNWFSWSDSSLEIARNQGSKMMNRVTWLGKQDHYWGFLKTTYRNLGSFLSSSIGEERLLPYSWTDPVS